MRDLIFVLPTFIIFFFILVQIFSLLKRGFNSLKKHYNLTIDQAGEETKTKNSKMEADYDQDKVKKRIAEAEKETVAESKKRILNQNSKSETKKEKAKKKYKEKVKRDKLNKEKGKTQHSSLGEMFSQYNEVEKAVIYNEILSKPKALKKD